MFSKATEYALRATIYIAQKGTQERKCSIDEIAKSIDSPQPFTAKILQALRKNNKVIRSATGPNGGFYMDPKLRKQAICVVLEAMGEGHVLEKCVLGLVKCSEIKPCPMHAQYKTIKAELIKLFTGTTIQHLADEIDNGDVFISNFNFL